MNVTGWRGATYGIRAGKKTLLRSSKMGCVEIEMTPKSTFNLSPKLDNLPGLRGIALAVVASTATCPMAAPNPPRLVLTPIGGNRFRLLL